MIDIKIEDYEFLVSSSKFCNGIEEYSALFGLDLSILNAYKSDNDLINDLIANNKDDGRAGLEYFISRKIKNMKDTFDYLADLCKCHESYTLSIGRYLGIEVEEEELYWFSEN